MSAAAKTFIHGNIDFTHECFYCVNVSFNILLVFFDRSIFNEFVIYVHSKQIIIIINIISVPMDIITLYYSDKSV